MEQIYKKAKEVSMGSEQMVGSAVHARIILE
jgi:hypothetical protein